MNNNKSLKKGLIDFIYINCTSCNVSAPATFCIITSARSRYKSAIYRLLLTSNQRSVKRV